MADYLTLSREHEPEDGTEATAPVSSGTFTHQELPKIDLTREYEVTVMAASFGASTKGNAMWTLTLGCLEEPNVGAVKHWLVNSPAIAWRTNEHLVALGLALPTAERPVTYTAADFVGKKALATFIYEDFKGQPKLKVSSLRATAEGPGARSFEAA